MLLMWIYRAIALLILVLTVRELWKEEKMQMKIRFTMPKEGNDEPLVTLQNRESETMKIEDEPAAHVPYLLYGGAASAAVFAAGVTWLLLRRQKKQEQ